MTQGDSDRPGPAQGSAADRPRPRPRPSGTSRPVDPSRPAGSPVPAAPLDPAPAPLDSAPPHAVPAQPLSAQPAAARPAPVQPVAVPPVAVQPVAAETENKKPKRTTRRDPIIGVVGLVLAVLAGVAGYLACTKFDWYHGNPQSHLDQVHAQLLVVRQRDNAANPVSLVYFDYLAETLLAAGVLLALIANIRSPLSGLSRGLASLAGVGGIIVTGLSINLITKGLVAARLGAPQSYEAYLKDAAKAPALYLAVGAFVLIMASASRAPRGG